MKKKELTKCKTCNKEFLYYKSAQPNRKFCSKKCSDRIPSYKKRVCLKCKKIFHPKSGNSLYCGSQYKKVGCSYLVQLELKRNIDKKKIKEKWKKYKEKNKEKLKIKYKNDWKINGEKIRIRRKARRLKLRFETMQKDNFTCQYCGRKAPEVELQVDHKYPKSKGGLDKIENYITSCRECNIGKGDCILNEFIN